MKSLRLILLITLGTTAAVEARYVPSVNHTPNHIIEPLSNFTKSKMNRSIGQQQQQQLQQPQLVVPQKSTIESVVISSNVDEGDTQAELASPITKANISSSKFTKMLQILRRPHNLLRLGRRWQQFWNRHKRSGISDQTLAQLEEVMRLEALLNKIKSQHDGIAFGVVDVNKIG